mmetsp:Transcript_53983/g.110190  ORF Transcript_53983/g.110190 Transcript_53983/m.110190 type:complete len:114 (+) Transcript_53983:1516-1857(+)
MGAPGGFLKCAPLEDASVFGGRFLPHYDAFGLVLCFAHCVPGRAGTASLARCHGQVRGWPALNSRGSTRNVGIVELLLLLCLAVCAALVVFGLAMVACQAMPAHAIFDELQSA